MRKYKLSLHVHTKYSQDSLLPFWLLYWKCRRERIDCIAVTDHNTAEGGLAFGRYCAERAAGESGKAGRITQAEKAAADGGGKMAEDAWRLHVIPGEEIMTSGGEIIGLYLTETIPPGMTPEETIAAVRAQGGIVCVPHPYEEKRRRSVLQEKYIAANAARIDCIERHNGRNTRRTHTDRQAQLAEKYGILPVIGEDAHTVFEIGRNAMLADGLPADRESFLRLMPSAAFSPPRYAGAIHHLTKFDRIAKFVLRGDFRGLYRFIHDRLVQKLQKMV